MPTLEEQRKKGVVPSITSTPVGAPMRANVGVPAPGYGIGFGGADYNQLNTAGKAAMSADRARLASDPSYAASEFDRANTVIANRDAKGLDNTAQNSYLNTVKGFMPKEVTVSSAPPVQPQAARAPQTPQGSYPGQLTADQIQQEAAARIAKLRAGVENAVTAGKAARKNAFDYTNQITGDNRTLQDASFHENHGSYGGGTDYQRAMLNRDRSIQDTANNNNYQADINALDNQLTSFDMLAPEQQQALYDQLTRQERDYGLQAGALTGQFNGSPTLAALGQQAQYTGVYGGQPTIQAQNQNFQQNLATNQFNNQLNEQAYNHARDSIMDERYKQTFDQNVQQQGFENALKLAVQQHQISNDNAQLAISQQNADTAQQNAGTSKDNATQSQLMDIWKATGTAPEGITGVAAGTPYAGQTAQTKDYSKDIDRIVSLYVTPGQYGGAAKVSNPTAMRNAIIALGMDDSETDRYLTMFGLPINQ